MADESARLMGRYVRPIYDAIDSRQYRAAIKLCLHKKVAHLDIVQVLKAHCLERTGRVDEALDICRQVQRKNPTDDTLLSTMGLVFRLGGCEHEMLPTYEYACAHASPPVEENFQALFVAYVRRGDFLKQQQTALKMYKAFGGGIKYVCWAALSMMLQVEHRGTPPKMLALAERMLLKALRDSKSDDGEALQLTVLMLQLQDKYTEALAVFDEFAKPVAPATSDADAKTPKRKSKKSTKARAAEGEGAFEEEIELGPMQAIDQLTLEASLAKRVGNWERCAAVNKKLLEEYNGDDWTFLTEYVGASFEHHGQQDGALVATLATVRETVAAFLTDLGSRPENARNRGPALAVIHLNAEILRRLHAADPVDKKEVEQTEERLYSLIVSYVDRFFSKMCCFTDLKQYLALFLDSSALTSAAAKAKLVGYVHSLSAESSVSNDATHEDGGSEEERKAGLARLSKRLLAVKTLRFLGFYDNKTITDLESLVKDLVSEYQSSNWLNAGSKGGQREVQPTDDLLLLAAHFLLDIYQREVSAGHARRELLLQTAGLLEFGLDRSAYNFQMKLLLSRVYGYLGAANAMLSRHAELDVKYVQLDSLSFLVYDKMLRLGHYPEARKLTESIRRLHRSTANDTPEFIARAYRLGVYSKVIDMTTFVHKRMAKAHTLAISQGESLRFALHDALVGGSTKLYELVTISDAFEKDVDALMELLASGADAAEVVSRNQHRDVVVEWAHDVPRIPTASTYQRDDAPLVECDRSADLDTSLAWLRLQTAVPRLLRCLALNNSDGVAAAAKEYSDALAALQLTAANGDDVMSQIWSWSESVVQVAASAAAALSSEDEKRAQDLWESVRASLSASKGVFSAITEQLPSELVFHSGDAKEKDAALSPYGVAAASTLLAEAGLSSLCVLALMLRAMGKKKSKKADGDAHAAAVHELRATLKHMQEALATLQTRVASLSITTSSSSASTVTLVAVEGLDMATSRAVDNVSESYKTVRQRLGESIHEGVTTIRTLLQK